MKRLFAILLALMLVIGMVGCGQDATTPTETTAPTIETTVPTTEPVSTDIPVVVTEQYAVYIVDVVYEPTYGATISFRLENLSPYNVTFHFSNYAINGVWEVEALTSIFDTEDVSIGHKQVIDRTFSATDLKQIGVDVIEVLEFNLDVYHTKADGTQDYLTGDVTDPYAITLVTSAE
jgi:hypothetical protein